MLRRCRVLLGRERGPVSDGCRRTLEAGVMKLAAVLDLLIGAGLAWMTYGLRGDLDSPDAWLAVGIGLLAVLMLASGAALVAGADWGPRLGRASSLGGLLVGGAALVVGSVLLIGGDRQTRKRGREGSTWAGVGARLRNRVLGTSRPPEVQVRGDQDG